MDDTQTAHGLGDWALFARHPTEQPSLAHLYAQRAFGLPMAAVLWAGASWPLFHVTRSSRKKFAFPANGCGPLPAAAERRRPDVTSVRKVDSGGDVAGERTGRRPRFGRSLTLPVASPPEPDLPALPGAAHGRCQPRKLVGTGGWRFMDAERLEYSDPARTGRNWPQYKGDPDADRRK
jgi:hypothetical protein